MFHCFIELILELHSNEDFYNIILICLQSLRFGKNDCTFKLKVYRKNAFGTCSKHNCVQYQQVN